MYNNLIKIISALKSNLSNSKYLQWLYSQSWNDYKSPKVNLGQIQSESNRLKKSIRNFHEVEFQVFSQFGDDGIIQWLIQQIPFPNKTFIEFGVENYRESNTRFLLINNYWSGLVIDGSPENIASLKREQLYSFYDIQAVSSFITRSNINQLITSSGFDKEVGLLSIDIDGNDYWIWKEINVIEPIIVICEYNSLFGFDTPYTIQYKDDFVRGKKYPFNFYGTSLKSAFDLAEQKGYKLIGSNSAGNNAYFIRNDYLKYLSIPALTPEEAYVFASFSEVWDKDKNPIRGLQKINNLNSLPVFNTANQREELLESDRIIASLKQSKRITRS